MNIDKFEYWAKRQGMSCVRSKVKWHNEMYTNKDTEQAYNYWVSATSSNVQELYEEQVELEMIYIEVLRYTISTLLKPVQIF